MPGRPPGRVRIGSDSGKWALYGTSQAPKQATLSPLLSHHPTRVVVAKHDQHHPKREKTVIIPNLPRSRTQLGQDGFSRLEVLLIGARQ
jgi:hypothetical protein